MIGPRTPRTANLPQRARVDARDKEGPVAAAEAKPAAPAGSSLVSVLVLSYSKSEKQVKNNKRANTAVSVKGGK